MYLEELVGRKMVLYKKKNSHEHLNKILDLLDITKTKKYEIDNMLDYVTRIDRQIEDTNCIEEKVELIQKICVLIDKKSLAPIERSYTSDVEMAEDSEISRKFAVSILKANVLEKIVKHTYQQIEAPFFN